MDLIFQVVNLQAQLASLKEQAASQCSSNPNDHYSHNFPQDVQSWFQNHHQGTNMPQFDANFHDNNNNMAYYSSGDHQMYAHINPRPAPLKNESCSFESMEMQGQWPFDQDDVADDLQSVPFRYIHH